MLYLLVSKRNSFTTSYAAFKIFDFLFRKHSFSPYFVLRWKFFSHTKNGPVVCYFCCCCRCCCTLVYCALAIILAITATSNYITLIALQILQQRNQINHNQVLCRQFRFKWSVRCVALRCVVFAFSFRFIFLLFQISLSS